MLTNDTYINTVKTSEGYAVFASKDIKTGDVIEDFIFRQGPWRSHDLDSRVGFLHQTAFMRSCPCPTCRQHGTPFLFLGGSASVYTHDSDPNAEVVLPDESMPPINTMLQGALVALKDIKKDEKITLNYALHYSHQKLDADMAQHHQEQQIQNMRNGMTDAPAPVTENMPAPVEA